MLKKPFSYYDDLEEIGYHHTVFKNDQVPLLAVIIPPGCFIGGGLMVFFMNLSFYLEDIELWEEGLYYLDSKPVFPFAGIFLPSFMIVIGLILLIFFLTLSKQYKSGIREKACIRYSPFNMHFVFGPRGEKEMPVIQTYRIKNIHIFCPGRKENNGEIIYQKYGKGYIIITFEDENNQIKKYKIKNIDEVGIVGDKMTAICKGGIY